jgi:uncharacterized membrane protein
MSLLKSWKNQNVKKTTKQCPTVNYVWSSRLLCHRIPERTFNFRGHYFPVCSRCTGFYLAGFSYFILVYFVYVQYTITLFIIAISMLIPTFLDGYTQLLGTRKSNNILRLCTGLMGGVGLAIIFKTIKWMILIG